MGIALEKTLAEWATNAAYGALGVGSVPKPGQNSSEISKTSPTSIIDIAAGGSAFGKIPTASIYNVKSISAAEANAPFISKGWNAPYDSATQVRTFTTATDLVFVRVSTSENPTGAFLVRANEISGMNPVQIQQHLALPKIPTQIAEVIVPAGTKMQVGKFAAQPEFGALQKGGTQYQLLQQIPTNRFGTPKPF